MSEEDQTIINLDGRTGECSRVDHQEKSAFGSYNTQTVGAADRSGGAGQLSDLLSRSASTVRPASQLEVKLPWYKGITWKDIRDILPTLLILFMGLLVMIIIIPYAFSSVIRQLQQEQLNSKLREMNAHNQSLAANQSIVTSTSG